MLFNPENPLTKEELDVLGKENFDSFLEYLDSKSTYLKSQTKPLGKYHLKRFAAISSKLEGRDFTDEDYNTVNKIGDINSKIDFDSNIHEEWVEKKHDMLKRVGVKNIKTHRSQWFD